MNIYFIFGVKINFFFLVVPMKSFILLFANICFLLFSTTNGSAIGGGGSGGGSDDSPSSASSSAPVLSAAPSPRLRSTSSLTSLKEEEEGELLTPSRQGEKNTRADETNKEESNDVGSFKYDVNSDSKNSNSLSEEDLLDSGKKESSSEHSDAFASLHSHEDDLSTFSSLENILGGSGGKNTIVTEADAPKTEVTRPTKTPRKMTGV